MAWTVLKENMSMGESNRRKACMVGDAAEIATPPENLGAAIGSIAFTADMTGFWVLDEDGEWTESTSEALALIGLI